MCGEASRREEGWKPLGVDRAPSWGSRDLASSSGSAPTSPVTLGEVRWVSAQFRDMSLPPQG